MNIEEGLRRKTGGQWLVNPVGKETVFCREMFTDEHKEVKKMIEQFSQEKIYPKIKDLDSLNENLSRTILQEMGGLGLIGVDTPEEYGGIELDKITSCIVAEGVSWGGSASFGCTFGVQTGIGSLGIVFFGTPNQKKKYLPKLMTGDWIAAYGLTEPSAGSDALSAKTTAILSEDGKHYIVNGEKQFISNGGWADVYTILVQIDGDKFSALIVDRGTEGLEVGAEEKKMGMKGSSTTSLKFINAKVPVENLLYKVGKGAVIAFNALNIGRYKLGAAGVGGSKLAIKETVKYALERRQFGQPIAKFDSIKGKIADATVQIYSIDTMLYRTVGMIQEAIDELDKGNDEYYILMGEVMERFAIESSMAKIYGSETSMMVVDNCFQIFGGYGYIEEYPMAMPYRDDRINRIWEGTNEINRAIITGYMMKKVLMEEISLRDFLSDFDEFSFSEVKRDGSDPLLVEKHALLASKKLAAYIFQAALIKFGQDLKHKQLLSESIADIFTHIYISGSVISRVSQTISSNDHSKMTLAIAKIRTAESLTKIKGLISNCQNNIFKSLSNESVKTTINNTMKKLSISTDTIALKKILADFIFAQKKYPF